MHAYQVEQIILTGPSNSRNCAFVNFTNISNAIKAIEGVKNKPDYANLRIAHGKDRCANPPRSGPQGGMRRSASGNGTMATPMSAVDHDATHFDLVKSDVVALGEDMKGEPADTLLLDANNVAN